MKQTQEAKRAVRDRVAAVQPFDDEEREHRADVLAWIDCGVDIFRIQKHAVPPKHLVAYTALVDAERSNIFLVDHRKSLVKDIGGGHVDINELPEVAAKRELQEEMHLSLDPLAPPQQDASIPWFVTVTDTFGITEKHTDVSLWYLFLYDSSVPFEQNEEFEREFAGAMWMSFDEVLKRPSQEFNPHLQRFLRKMKRAL